MKQNWHKPSNHGQDYIYSSINSGLGKKGSEAAAEETRSESLTLTLLCQEQPCNTGKSNVPLFVAK